MAQPSLLQHYLHTCIPSLYQNVFPKVILTCYTKHIVKHPDSLMVWDCLSYHSVDKQVFLLQNTTMNHYNYFELILDRLDDYESVWSRSFHAGRAPYHTAKLVQNYTSWILKLLMPWPGTTPDINPIKNLWTIIECRLHDWNTSCIPHLQNAIKRFGKIVAIKIYKI